MGRFPLPLVLCVVAACLGCAYTTDHAMDLGEAGAAVESPDRMASLTALALDRSARPDLRAAAVYSLSRIGGPDAVAPLTTLARAEEASPFRRRAVWGLAQTGAPPTVPILVEIAESRTDAPIVLEALLGLARLSDLFEADTAVRRDVLRAVNAAESGAADSPQIRAAADLLREHLANLDDFALVLSEATERGETARALNALSWTGDLLLEDGGAAAARERALTVLTGLVESDGQALRLRSLWYLGRLRSPGTARLLAETARTREDRATRMLAVWALWRTDPALFAATFRPMPRELLTVTPGNWREARDRAAELGEPDLEIQRLIADLLQEGGR